MSISYAEESAGTLSAVDVIRSLALFFAAGIAEIGGGYLVWRWVREDGSGWLGVAGALVLIGYGVIPTLQRGADFGRVYAAYGGVFVIMSLVWAYLFDGSKPDRYDVIGAVIVSVGVAVIFLPSRA